jgi:hypothetical protein
VSGFPTFLLAFLVIGAIFCFVVLIHHNWLREHTKDWAPTAADVLKYIDGGGDGPDRYLLQYTFDGKIYRVETNPRLVPVCSPAKAGSRITVLVNPYSPHECASNVGSRESRTVGPQP